MRATRSSVVAIALFAILLSSFGGLPHPARASQTDATWTVMLYMADDFVSSLNWQDDVNEMEAAEHSPETNVIALVDSYGPNNSMLLYVAHDPNFLDSTIVSTRIDDGGVVITGGEVNMASASTLSRFIEFVAANYSAEHYALVLWGHGAGWRGLCPDGTDIMTLPELASALSTATGAMARPLDIIAVDSCAEANIEMLYQVHAFAKVFVGSEMDVPFQGLPYVLVMNDLAADPAQSPERFGRKIVDDYVGWSKTNSEYSATMGLFNLSKVGTLMDAIDLFSAQGVKYDQIFHEKLTSALNSSETYEEPHSVDFGHLMLLFQASDVPLEMRYLALECILRYAEVVEHFEKYNNLDPTDGVHVYNASGLTIYAPSNDLTDASYSDLTISLTSWSEFGRALRNNTQIIANSQGPTIYLSASNISSFDQASIHSIQQPLDTATLVWPSNYSSVVAWVFRNESGSLVYQAVQEASGDQIRIQNTPGILIVAASATSASGQAISYVTLNLVLEGMSTIKIQLLKNGEPVDAKARYDYSIHSPTGGILQHLDETGSCSIVVAVPEFANIGDLLTIEVRDPSSHTLVGQLKAFVPPHTATLQIELTSERNANVPIAVPFVFALLPALLILAFTWMLYSQQKKKMPPS